MLISSGILVQPDEGVSELVVDRIGENYRSLPRRAGFLKHRLVPGTSASKEEYYVWKIRMQAHLAAQNDDMWEVITNGPLKIMKANPAFAITGGAPEWIKKSRVEYNTEDKKKANLDNVAKDILYKELDNDMFSYIKTCANAKEIWEKLTQICEGNDRKVFVAEESNKHWADSYSDYTSSSSSSSDSEQEEVNCLMANDSMEDEVFDFSNDKFTREELISALNEMVNEYKILSQTFKEVKAENRSLKNSSEEPSTDQLGESDSLKTEIIKLKTENESLRMKIKELTSDNNELNYLVSSWQKSSASLNKITDNQKSMNDKSGVGFDFGKNYIGETSTQSNLAGDKFKKLNFVKSSVAHDINESIEYNDQISGKMNQEGKNGIGYVRPEFNRPIWLRNRLSKTMQNLISKHLFLTNKSAILRK
ncbi:hypothetical protein F511_41330 [Dorcoceras hygrometricum]|uniref:Uncharacterized protein n=1 Tax=Dorcoceras hygrometricum TaxID=472368 RepID=A0A2Z7AXN3_9LAMI|nr:hypothetical protein F511_41330 [Dorcoceras hygrometricum]